MPTAVVESVTDGPPDEQEPQGDQRSRMWVALKAHVLRERARKRQQREAEVEEERLRRERERQDVMTLGETREQISDLELRLAQLKEEKHQLFRQLKKVLHEDDNRRRQKENVFHSDMIAGAVPQIMATSGMHPQLFVSAGPQGQPAHPQGAPQNFKNIPMTGGKRGRSPSPPQQQQTQVTYAPQQSGGYAAYKVPSQQQQYQQQKEDTRRPHEFVRAVLWNKPSQYTNQPGSSYYTVQPTDRSSIVYYSGGGLPCRNTEVTQPRGPPAMYESYGLPSVARSQPATHVNVHGGAIPITPAQPASKTGSITAGYPVRNQSLAHYDPQTGIYTSGGPGDGRHIYTGPSGAPIAGYPPPPRE